MLNQAKRIGISVLVSDTVKSLIALNISLPLSNDNEIHVEGKIGIDGSGSHQVRHQLSENRENICDTSYIGCVLVPYYYKIEWS